ncbi:MAG: IPT/TIG domain-containing protein, partial [bacterium]
MSASPANLPSSGSVGVLIGGSSFGGLSDGSLRLRIGSTTLIRSIWQSDSAVACFAVAGGGVGVVAVLTAGSSVGSTSMLFSYDVFVPKPFTGGVGNAPSSGQTLVTVSGSGAGLFGY